MAIRKPAKKPDGSEWKGKRVRYCPRHPHPHPRPEFGTVLQMASAKELAMFVMFDSQMTAKMCYARDLERI